MYVCLNLHPSASHCPGSLIFSVLSPQSKNVKRRTDQHYSSVYWLAKGNTSSRRAGRLTQKTRSPQRPPAHLAIFWLFYFYVSFLSPLDLPYVNWASEEGCLFSLRNSLWSLDLPLFYFLGLFTSSSFIHRYFGLLFPVLTT